MRNYISIFFCLFVLSEGSKEGPDVVNGIDAKIRERPFQVSLQLAGKHFCGGSIISPDYVLTAAHCEDGFYYIGRVLSAVAGMIDLDKPGQRRPMKKFIKHENYASDFVDRHDIALIELLEPFTFDSDVQPVRLPSGPYPFPPGSALVLSGWGSLGGADHKLLKILQVVVLQYVNQQWCKKRVDKQKPHRLFDTNMCAWDPNDRKGACEGDSGGPLTLGPTQVGISSWSLKDPYCGSRKLPYVYTRVSRYVNWIQEHTHLNISELNKE